MNFLKNIIEWVRAKNQLTKNEVYFYLVFCLFIRRKFIRKTNDGIITKEITITQNIIVQFIPIISPNSV